MDLFKQRLSGLFDNHPELKRLQQQVSNAWLVGGTLRDLLLNRPVVDIDIAVDGDPTPIAQAWSHEVGGRWFWLDPDRMQSRVLLPNQLSVDFTPLRAPTIAEDQALRDYTINSLALSLQGDLSQSVLLDPLGGLTHLEQNCLQLCSLHSIPDDPLRMLKGVRHAVTLRMALSELTLQRIKAQAGSIGQISGERIRDELGKILSAAQPVAGLKLLHESGLLHELFGPGNAGWDAGQTFAALEQLDLDLNNLESVPDDEPAVEDPFSTRALFLLATLLRDYAPENLPALLHVKLRLSKQQQRILSNLQQQPPQQWFDQVAQVTTGRQKALLVEGIGFFPDEQLLYWAVYRKLVSLDKVHDLLQAFRGQQQLGRVPDLLSGHQLRELLKGRPDKEIGLWQERVKSAELTGEITTESDARQWLKSEISD